MRRPPRSPLFPSPTLFRSSRRPLLGRGRELRDERYLSFRIGLPVPPRCDPPARRPDGASMTEPNLSLVSVPDPRERFGDRKSTRLNSSHGYISNPVFSLKTNLGRSPCSSHSRSRSPGGGSTRR